jgi:hypothetical protein
MEEREKYESWLDDLEAKKDSTPPKVFERVRQDYLTRLQEVVDKLSEHTALLEEHGQSLSAKLRELEMAEESISEQQAEAALRKQVGEITPAEWESSSRKAQKELAKLRENQESIAEELDRIRNLLGDEEEEVVEERPAKKKPKDFNELEFLTKVVGTSAPTPDAFPPVKPRSTPQGSPATRSSGPSTARATPSGNPTATSGSHPAAPAAPPPAAVAPPAPAPTPAASASTSGESRAVPPPTPAATAAASPTETPSMGTPNQPRKSMMAEQPKTLKCGECGTMNLPSEWYCERCGAELTIV